MSVQLEQLNPFAVLACYLEELIWAHLARAFATLHRGAALEGPGTWQQRSCPSCGGCKCAPQPKSQQQSLYTEEPTLWHLPPHLWIWLSVLLLQGAVEIMGLWYVSKSHLWGHVCM